MVVIALAGCSAEAPPNGDRTSGAASVARPVPPTPTPAQPEPARAQPQLASDPVQIADDLVADEHALRNPASSPGADLVAARRQQKAYRVLAVHPEWDALTRPRIPVPLREVYDRNIDARRQLGAMGRGKATLPAWRVHAPLPADRLLGYYREAEAQSGVSWNYLAAINFVETAFGRIAGVSTAGAQGPMQFMPSTFATYGAGSDIHSARDSILAAGRFLAAHGFTRNRDSALYRYNNSNQYVRAINQYAAVIALHPDDFAGYYHWDVYYKSTAGDVVLPVGYAADAPAPVEQYLATHPQ
jgi:soluble lytic murein transglycosylase-like protein